MSYRIKRRYKLSEDASSRHFSSLRRTEPLLSKSKSKKKAYKTYKPVPTRPYTPKKTKPYTPIPPKPYTPMPLKDYTPEPLKPYKPVLLKDYTPEPLKSYIPAPLKDYTPMPLKPYKPVSLNDYTPVPLKPYTPVPLKPYTPVPLKPYTPKSSRRKGSKGKLIGDGKLSEETCPFCGETVILKTSGVLIICHNCKNKLRYSPEE